eukprot:gb/GFBE01032652.1/.p1 GENE.gb/GFBE01032652.1/~~gb/GFBE01032652.1/.p1  ORF type:complete len:211 (+),score=50.84 gb/GFBE01032652.1/:1-633(+)
MRRGWRRSAVPMAMCFAAALMGLRHRLEAFVPSADVGSVEAQGGRRLALLGSTALLLSGVGSKPAQAQSFFSSERFDGSFTDDSKSCDEEALGIPKGSCMRTITCNGGFATIRGKDSPEGDMWEIFASYDGQNIEADFSKARKGGPKKLEGKWFSNKKLEQKGIKWKDGTTWEKMEYKITPSPNEVMETAGSIRNAEIAAREAAEASAAR